MNRLRYKGLIGVSAIALLATVAVTARKPAISADGAVLERRAALGQLMKDLWDPLDETDAPAPIDYGAGPGVKPKVMAQAPAVSAGIPVGAKNADVTGVFGPVVTWPIIPIHVLLLPDGRVMNYGTNESGQQGAELLYDIWSPTVGTGTNAHTILPNTTPTDLFCSSQSMLLTGDALITGGDLTVDGQRNFARNDTNLFSPTADTLTSNTPMNYARWYGSLISMPDGTKVVFGGIQNQTPPLSPLIPVLTPELYDPATRAWATLTGATSSVAFGLGAQDWYYPRVFVAPGGNLFLISDNGPLYWITTAGAGTITRDGIAPAGLADLPTVMFTPGKVVSIRQNQEVVVIDFTKRAPVVTQTDPIDQVRLWASGTVLADGTVLVTGGSEVKNKLVGVDYTAEMWNPTTGHWTAGATAAKPRLYHSNALLLPDATVLTGGGGAPGPVINLNAEIFYPPYLYASSGAAAVRPVLSGASPKTLAPGATLSATVGATDVISRLTFVRTGSATHSQNPDQRFIDLSFSQAGQNLTAVLPSDPTVLVPGYYMLFAISDAGVPSIAQIILVN
ncbi:MAG: galactose oxidase-like domain-containing protein [Steroidobacteraceae bacterium]